LECKYGHQWKTRPASIYYAKTWCPYCAGYYRKTIDEMNELAAKNGGKCLSETYINNNTKLEWQCGKGHIWEAAPLSIKANNWCPVCKIESKVNKQRVHLEKYRKIAIERGGKLLSEVYHNIKEPLLWECKNGHQWKATPAYLKGRGNWCRICNSIKRTRNKTEIYRQIAIERGGKLLSDVYINCSKPLLWECKKGHQWKARPTNIKNQRKWCPYCRQDAPNGNQNISTPLGIK
jgi:thiol-disulfide isomerase/thioredoxin